MTELEKLRYDLMLFYQNSPEPGWQRRINELENLRSIWHDRRLELIERIRKLERNYPHIPDLT